MLPVKRIHRLLLLGTLLWLAYPLYAQQAVNSGNAIITGRIIDSANGQPVEYATLSLNTYPANTVVNGGTADEKGLFTLTGVAVGTYKVLVAFIGYKTKEIDNIIITKKGQSLFVGDIKLASLQKTLTAVTVTADKDVIENKIDKLVYNVDKDITSQGGVATDALKKIPEISVDVDGNVELQGDDNIRFLIDGKPSTIFGTNIVDVLQSIPASQIQSIEVITSPGAKYDAEGTGGIINIILKKSTAEGVNGSISLTGGTRLENTSVNLHARKGNIGVYGFFSGNATLFSTSYTNINRAGIDTNGQITQLLQDGYSSFTRDGYQTGGGFDWEINSRNSIYGGVSYDYYVNNRFGAATQQNIQQDMLGNTLSDVTDILNTTSNYNDNALDYNITYRKTFAKKDQELNVSYNSSTSNTFYYYSQNQEYAYPTYIYGGSYGNNPATENQKVISLDYTQPVTENTTFEMGAKTTLDEIQSISDVYLLNTNTEDYSYSTTESSALTYKQNIYAAYFSATFKLFNFLDAKAGLRDEYTQINAYFADAGNVNIPSYNTYVPSAIIAHTFNNVQTIKLSYTYRIERPEYDFLDPFVNVSDPKNISTGNPYLKPELGHKIELGYNRILGKDANIYTTLFYRWNLQDLQPYTTYYTSYKVGDSTYNNTAVTERANIGQEDDIGLSISGSVPILKKIKLRPNVQFFQRYIYTGLSSGGNTSGFNYRINLNSSYDITSNLTLELFGTYNSASVNAEGTKPLFLSYNLAIREQLFHKKGSIAFVATNPFNYYVNQTSTLTDNNFTTTTLREVPYQSFGLNFTYRFGKMEFKEKKEEQDTHATEQGDN